MMGNMKIVRGHWMVLWFNPGKKRSTTLLLVHSPQQHGGENQKGKSEKSLEYR